MNENEFLISIGCPAHYSRGLRQWLNIPYHFPRRWINRAEPVAWLPRLSNLTLLDLLWSTLKQKIYAVFINDESLKQRIMQACENITDAQCQSATGFITYTFSHRYEDKSISS